MKKGPIIAIVVIIAVIIILWWVYEANPGSQSTTQAYPTSTGASSTPGTPSSPGGSGAPYLPAFDQTISDGIIMAHFPSRDFGLATNQKQIPVKAAIPPCDGAFNYCLYYNHTSTYAGTNFESAGIRIQKRPTLTTERFCLNTSPAGYRVTLQPNATSSADTYSTSVFNSIGGAAAGSYDQDSLYRFYYRPANACYEFETRIAESQYANYPSGTIKQFTDAARSALQSEIQAVLGTLTIASSGEAVGFP